MVSSTLRRRRRAGVDVNGGHGFSLVDDQIAATGQIDPTPESSLYLLLHAIQIEQRARARMMLQPVGHFRDEFLAKPAGRENRCNRQPGCVAGRPGQVARHAQMQRQVPVQQGTASSVAAAVAHRGPKPLEKA